ncbi:MAG: glycosyltransferase [Verrucomicrobiota bacterium]
MKLMVVLEHRFAVDADGNGYSRTAFGPSFWERYLEVFEQVIIVARAEMQQSFQGWRKVTSDRVKLHTIPPYLGPLGLLKAYPQVRRRTLELADYRGAVLYRVPSFLAETVHRLLVRGKRPFAVEVVGDPWDTFSPGANSHPLRGFFRRYFSQKLKHFCREATCSLYVTEKALQRRYPPRAGSFSVGVSDVELSEVCSQARTQASFNTQEPELIFVGNIEYAYKGLDVLIHALGKLKQAGRSMRLKVLGDGRTRQSMQALAQAEDIQDQVIFLGRVPNGDAVNRELDSADVFVLASRQEGLPRAMVEAMARALPCVGTTVGGIPELLSPECLVAPGDAAALATTLDRLAADSFWLAAESEKNLVRAEQFIGADNAAQRRAFYETLKSASLVDH